MEKETEKAAVKAKANNSPRGKPRPAIDVPRDKVMRRDVFKLRREQDSERRGVLLAASESLRSNRAGVVAGLDLTMAAGLPIAEHAEEISQLIQQHQVVVVAGETGSGKTTQLPKLCLQLGLGVGAMIGHTQPRRLAARTVAKRIAQEVGGELGAEVGFAVRFSDQVGDQTLLKVMTDGILLTEVRKDRFLDAYDAIIIDEAHERSLNIDFLLGYLKRLLRRRKDLKVIITSATIDVDRFAKFFNDAPIVTVSGRAYPVEVRYLDAAEETSDGLLQALEEIDARSMSGARDVLAFFSGEREIFEAARLLRKAFTDRFEILPLYARLSFAEQRRIFESAGGKRRVILATNVAETSLTVPNIGYVIDPGLARVNRYSYRSKLQRLPIEPISQASADQRKGRCGRIAPGICFRLYSEQDFSGRAAFTDAEIHRVNLASVVLQMEAFKLGDVRTFEFLDPPDPRAIKDAMRLLEELQAITQGKLTDVGRAMARMPVDPRLARMLVEGARQGAVDEMVAIVSALAVQDVRERPLQKAGAADALHAQFADEKSDFVAILNLWRWLEEQRQTVTRSRLQTVLKKRFISPQRVREWREVHRQLRLVCKDLGYRVDSKPASYQVVHESILAGSLSLIAQHDERGQYVGARDLKLRIFPGSSLANRTPKWLVAGEINETSRVYARQVGVVEPGWIERQARHLIKSQYSAPFWSLTRGEVMAHKNVSLYGLRLAERRLVSYASMDPVHCRDLFIREGLVQGRVEAAPDFLRHNLAQTAEIEALEAKGRRRDLMVSEDELYAFYTARLPEQVCRLSDLNKWLRGAHTEQLNALYMTSETLMRVNEAGIREVDFPAELELADFSFDLKYRFAPGEADDGVTVRIPVGVLAGVGAEVLEWSVPGLLPNLIEQWLRTLPKAKRRNLVPLPDKVAALSAELVDPGRYRKGRLLTALGRLLNQRYKVEVSESDWDRARVDQHLLINVQVVDEKGNALAAGRDIRALKLQLAGDQDTSANTKLAQTFTIEALTDFPDRPIQGHEILGDVAAPIIKYPGLVDRGQSVDLILFDSERERDQAHRQGLVRLALTQLGKVGGYFRRELDKHPKLGLHFASLGNAQQLKDELLRNVIWFCFFEGRPLPSTQPEFAQNLALSKGRLADVFNQTVGQFAEIMALRFACIRAMEELKSAAYAESRAELEAHLNFLVPMSLLETTPSGYLPLLPRYLQGVLRRIEHLPGHVPKDLRIIKEIQPLLQRYENLCNAELADSDRCIDLRFYIEELRLTMFAEQISRTKVTNHPLDRAYFAPGWKASTKRVASQILAEEQRVGLA
jgi:ATP-dependent helicase HrpA